jgi:hypothetical protein
MMDKQERGRPSARESCQGSVSGENHPAEFFEFKVQGMRTYI